jgi:hypothetical protein
MLKSMWRVAGKFVEVLTGRTFLMMAGWALVSSAHRAGGGGHLRGWHCRWRHGAGLRR